MKSLFLMTTIGVCFFVGGMAQTTADTGHKPSLKRSEERSNVTAHRSFAHQNSLPTRVNPAVVFTRVFYSSDFGTSYQVASLQNQGTMTDGEHNALSEQELIALMYEAAGEQS